MIITKIFTFDSAHKLEGYDGDCANLHGHRYVLHVSVKGEVDEQGFVIDFRDLNKIVKTELKQLDHHFLNDVIEQPTAENIVIWIWEQLKEKLDLYELKLYETEDSYVVYSGN